MFVRALTVWLLAIAIFTGVAQAQTAPEVYYLPIHGNYLKAVKTSLVKNWLPLHSYPYEALCPIQIRQVEGGGILSVSYADRCMLDVAERERLEAAIMMGGNLPFEGFERWFWPSIVVDLRPWDIGVETTFSAQDSNVKMDGKSLQRFNAPFPEGILRFSGTATVLVGIDAEGDVDRLAVETSSGSAEMDQHARYLAAHWTYFPQVEGGKRVPSIVRVPVNLKTGKKSKAAVRVYIGQKGDGQKGDGGSY